MDTDVKAENEFLDHVIVKEEYVLKEENVPVIERLERSTKKDPQESVKFVIKEVRERKHKCPLCDKASYTIYNLKDHMVTHSKDKNFQCSQCSKFFGSKRRLDSHMRTHSTDLIPCGLCDKKFKSSVHLKYHLQRHTGEKKHECEICGKKFSDSSHKRRHILQLHEGKKPDNSSGSAPKFTCEHCGKVMWVKGSYERHILVVHTSNRDIKCPQCPKTFKLKYNLKEHMLVHSNEKPFVCDICNTGFKRKANLLAHRANHEGIPQDCSYCTNTYKSKGSLRLHIKKHHRGLPYEITDGPLSCTVCKEVFQDLDILKDHTKIHAKEKAKYYTCGDCGKSVRHKYNFLRHLTVHKKNTSFECETCSKKFKRKDEIIKHMRIHSKNRPLFECEVCGVKVKNRKTLRDHDRKHNAEVSKRRPYNTRYKERLPVDPTMIKQEVEDTETPLPTNIEILTTVKNEVVDDTVVVKTEADYWSKVYEGYLFDVKSVVNVLKIINFALILEKTEIHSKVNLIRVAKKYNMEENFNCEIVKEEYILAENEPLPSKAQDSIVPARKKHKFSICEKELSSLDGLKVHLKIHSNERNFKCPHCPKAFMMKKMLNRHLKIHTERKRIPCSLCDKSFLNKIIFNRHIKLHSEREKYECEICGKIFFEKAYRTRHMKLAHNGTVTYVHGAEKPFVCSICNMAFTKLNIMKRHKTTIHAEKRTDCPYCNKKFLKRNNYTNHIRTIHPGLPTRIKTGPTPCNICKETFSGIEDLKKHVVEHYTKKEFECAICGKKYVSKRNLKVHITTRHARNADKEILCTQCGKVFLGKSSLTLHQRTHTDNLPFECSVCSRKFKIKYYLTAHMKIHLEYRKTFPCKYCKKELKTKFIKEQHEQKHKMRGDGVPLYCVYDFKKKTYQEEQFLKYHEGLPLNSVWITTENDETNMLEAETGDPFA
ncbi:zinc finger protein 91-like [Phlebotomus papatasi]|uniref:zinc finger protein 91-like n=1 Tax=Phlebotomus papatasi TaxID=29031 RepID=UPI002483A946|nr:zinc finger protein 91-like [Phlebotomus papatasi]